MRRGWPEETEALRENGCVFSDMDCEGRTELAHITKRRFDRPRTDYRSAPTPSVWVEPESILPMCSHHHRLYDAGHLDVIAHLSTRQQVRAIEDYGSITKALERIAPSISRRINAVESTPRERLEARG